jgi:hypothetical protein
LTHPKVRPDHYRSSGGQKTPTIDPDTRFLTFDRWHLSLSVCVQHITATFSPR